MKKLPVLLLCCLAVTVHGQFVLNGDAFELGDGCFQLTEEITNQAGSVWYDSLINLEDNFEVNFEIYLGDLDASGADGIAFVLQPVSTGLGSTGGGLGYEDIEPSLAIEFDTWQNADNSDPSYDHMAIMQDGVLSHSAPTALTPVTQILSGSINAEDGAYHQVRITWNPATQEVQCFVDCDLRISYTGDIVSDIFGGDPFVYMGFTAATGGSFNDQIVCLDYITAVDELADVLLCPGDSVQLTVPEGFASYNWSPATGVSDPTIFNPWFTPTVTTTYTVTLTDECGNTITDDVTITIGSPELVDLGDDLELCEGSTFTYNITIAGGSYLWNNGSTLPIFTISEPGTYSVAVQVGTCVDADTVNVNYNPVPLVNFGPYTVVCGLDETLILDATNPGATYLWQDGSTAPIFEVNDDGLYFVTATLGICSDQDSIAVNYSSFPSVNLGPDILLCPDETATIIAGDPVFVYTWIDGSTGNTLTVSTPGTYYVDVNSNGCVTRAFIDVIPDPCICEIIVPDAFTPNNDGVNDIFKQLDCSLMNQYNMKIFNRWGQMVFETSDINQGWDGKFGDRECEVGAYVYVIEYDIEERGSGISKGSLLLIR